MSDAKRDFNKVAASWDENPMRMKLARDVASAIKETVAISPDADALDFGCGTGLLTLNLQPAVKSITGVDSSDGMLAILTSKIDALGLTNVKALHRDLEKGDSLGGTYHLITSSMTLHHVKDLGPLLDQFNGHLAPGGHLAVADLDLDDGEFHEDSTGVFHNGFDRKKLREEFQKAGFTDIKDKTAATMVKPVKGGGSREFSIFLMTGSKKK